jgi:class 3 adenylate cyclase
LATPGAAPFPSSTPPSRSYARAQGIGISPPLRTEAGERRYLTVMFCDLVDSMGIVARLDAADTHLLLAEGRSASDQVDRPAVHAIVASVA